ncbi:MAG: PQQ-binding-like beta-propeller repeat protein [Acidobacteriota bacterium]
MSHRLASILCVLGLWLGASSSLIAEPQPWPHWRGPHWNGTQVDANPPIHFSEEKNVRFKVDVPGEGLASPILYDGVVYLLSAEAADAEALAESQKVAQERAEKNEWPPAVKPVAQRFLVLAYDAETGRELWRRVASEHVPHETHYLDASWASATPATDGERLYAHFGSNGTYAYTLDGELLWQVDLGNMETRNGFGEGTSPVIWGDSLLIAWDHEGESALVALDRRTGEELWRTARPEERSSWATPLVVDPDGEGDMAPQIVLPGTARSRGYDAATGKELWSLCGMTMLSIPTPVARGSVVYLMSGFRGTVLQAIDLQKAKGALEESPAVVFTHDRHTPYVPSPVLIDDNLCFLKHTRGGISCLDAATGAVRYTEKRLPGINNVYGSPVAAAGHIYVFDKDGSATVIKDGPTFEVVAENQLDEPVDSTPAIYGDSLYVRSRHHLYRFARDPAENAGGEAAPAEATSDD